MAVAMAVGCDENGECSDECAYIIKGLVVAAADLVGVYLIGVPVGTLVSGASKDINAATSGEAQPDHVDVKYETKSDQGIGQIFDFSDMPKASNKEGKLLMDTQGKKYIHTNNPIGDSIKHVTLYGDDNIPVLPTNKGFSGFMRDSWRPGEDIYFTGLPVKQYTHIDYITTNDTNGTIYLV